MQNTAEYQRITGDQREQWHRWGSYLGGRAWSNIRESNVSEKKPWDAFPFEHARSRAFRWTEDGIGGFSDDQQQVCLSVALWNGQDPILKERYFGLGNTEGNHGEGVRDYFFHLDGLPSYSYMKMLYKYPQVEFPYTSLRVENARRSQDEPAFELIDALKNTFAENRYFDIFIEYAKADTDDILCRITAINRGSEAAPLHLLPLLWFRNTWHGNGARPELRADGEKVVRLQHPELGMQWWSLEAPDELLFTENETNAALLFDQPNTTPYVKDGIDYAIVRGQRARVNPDRIGTKCAAHYFALVEPGEAWIVRTRLQTVNDKAPFTHFDAVFDKRIEEADEFYAELQEKDLSVAERTLQRTAFAGLNWNKNFYHFNVTQWLKGDGQERKPKQKEENPFTQWRHFDAHDVISIPDLWEYPWFATWDLDFQVSTLCLIDAEFAKQQVLLFLDERYMRSDGAIPAFEGDLETPHPPIHAWAAWHVYQMTTHDLQFLQRAYSQLKRNYDWWLKTQQYEHSYLFSGGFLGMDNISIFNRTEDVPEGAWLAQADGTGWMALFTLNMLAIAIELGEDKDAAKFLQHFIKIKRALLELWGEESHFFYDMLHMADGSRIPLKIRSVAGLVPFTAVMLLDPASFDGLPHLSAQINTLRKTDPTFQLGANGCYMLAALTPEKITYLFNALLDPDEFYSDYGLRSLSKYHEKHPVTLKIEDEVFTLSYEPGDARSNLFGGNSNWRGPIWTPLNHLVIEALYYFHEYFGDTLPMPGKKSVILEEVASDLVERLISLFKQNKRGDYPFFGNNEYFQSDVNWRDYVWFYEHFHAETGQGLGASHQNGWTALIAKLIQTRGRAVFIPRPRTLNQNKTIP